MNALSEITLGIAVAVAPVEVQRLRIVLTPAKEPRLVRQAGPPTSPDPAATELPRAA